MKLGRETAALLALALTASVVLNVALIVRRGEAPDAPSTVRGVAAAAAPAAPGPAVDGSIAQLTAETRSLRATVTRLERSLAQLGARLGDPGEAPSVAPASSPPAETPARADGASPEVSDLLDATERFERWRERQKQARELERLVSADEYRDFYTADVARHLGFEGGDRELFIGALDAAWDRLAAAEADYWEEAKAQWRLAEGRWRDYEMPESALERFMVEREAARIEIEAFLDPEFVPAHRLFVARRGVDEVLARMGDTGIMWSRLADETGIPQQ